ncbi:hypothetical protein GCM10010346_27890 [Streptomyces chryseus]|uniref:Uncharacterized protein n=1 Tax=Streptomyces chryseus TaxID=68186 RepID=A0ABQ3DLJ9_9ACTN|nr:hypothetical protein GCM10010346_27890 [Streptomyces chryseus]
MASDLADSAEALRASAESTANDPTTRARRPTAAARREPHTRPQREYDDSDPGPNGEIQPRKERAPAAWVVLGPGSGPWGVQEHAPGP